MLKKVPTYLNWFQSLTEADIGIELKRTRLSLCINPFYSISDSQLATESTALLLLPTINVYCNCIDSLWWLCIGFSFPWNLSAILSKIEVELVDKIEVELVDNTRNFRDIVFLQLFKTVSCVWNNITFI